MVAAKKKQNNAKDQPAKEEAKDKKQKKANELSETELTSRDLVIRTPERTRGPGK